MAVYISPSGEIVVVISFGNYIIRQLESRRLVLFEKLKYINIEKLDEYEHAKTKEERMLGSVKIYMNLCSSCPYFGVARPFAVVFYEASCGRVSSRVYGEVSTRTHVSKKYCEACVNR